MAFLIKEQDSNLSNFIDYEKEIIIATAKMNCIWIDFYQPENLCLTCLGVRYKNDKNLDHIEHISEMIIQGFGKCDSIVAWYMAVYSYVNIESEPVLIKRSASELHAQMKIFKNGKGILIDPSLGVRKLDLEFCNKCKGSRGKLNGMFSK